MKQGLILYIDNKTTILTDKLTNDLATHITNTKVLQSDEIWFGPYTEDGKQLTLLIEVGHVGLYINEVLPNMSYIFTKEFLPTLTGSLNVTTLYAHKPAIITIYHEDENERVYLVLCPYHDNATMILEDVNDYQAVLDGVISLIDMVPNRDVYTSRCVIL